MTRFSVVVATRNRPNTFGRALRSIVEQSCDDIELVIVDDGSDQQHLAAYRSAIAACPRQSLLHSLPRYAKGHGPAFARNVGAMAATGDYICFLDDDDSWTDPTYLARIERVVTAAEIPPDLIFSGQSAFYGDAPWPHQLWLQPLADSLQSAHGREIEFYSVSIEDLVQAGSFCHMNTMVVRRALYSEIGGMDETIRWEEDHDLFLRLIDAAKTMLLSPAVVARHNIPDSASEESATTQLAEIERRMIQLRVFDKAILFAANPAIRAYAKLHKGYTLKRIVRELAARGEDQKAALYAREALAVGPTVGWAAYTMYAIVRANLARYRL